MFTVKGIALTVYLVAVVFYAPYICAIVGAICIVRLVRS